MNSQYKNCTLSANYEQFFRDIRYPSEAVFDNIAMKPTFLLTVALIALFSTTDAGWFRRRRSSSSSSCTCNCVGHMSANTYAGLRGTLENSQTDELFSVSVNADECNFYIYDKNRDKVVSPMEMVDIFGDDVKTMTFFEKFDRKTGDGVIDQEEFYDALPSVIEGCDKK